MSARRRALLVLLSALALAALTWLASALLGNSRISFGTGDAGVSVATEFPAATCSKSFHRDFPWVRFACEPREREGSETPQ